MLIVSDIAISMLFKGGFGPSYQADLFLLHQDNVKPNAREGLALLMSYALSVSRP
ncbi:MAG: hypothetical protein WAW41_00620 [Methylobacter sp.]